MISNEYGMLDDALPYVSFPISNILVLNEYKDVGAFFFFPIVFVFHFLNKCLLQILHFFIYFIKIFIILLHLKNAILSFQ